MKLSTFLGGTSLIGSIVFGIIASENPSFFLNYPLLPLATFASGAASWIHATKTGAFLGMLGGLYSLGLLVLIALG